MSDLGRKSVGDQFKETITPDSQKSTLENVTESTTTAADKVAAAVQPGDSKSTSQKLSDETRSTADSAQGTGKTYVQQATDAVSGVLASAGQAASDAAQAITGEKK